MRHGPRNLPILSVLVLLHLVGCASRTSSFHIPEQLGVGQTVLTSADLRGMNTVPVTPGDLEYGRVTPRQITCVEPSADLAKAISSTTGVGTSFSFGGLFGAGTSGDGAASTTQSVSEAGAQMTNRLAVIQLLRDALYRACEAYGNGALSSTSYAVLLSRYDDVMVTMLLGELAAGNFGGELASLGGSAGSSASAAFQQQRVDAEEAQDKAKADKTAADAELKERQQAVTSAEDKLNALAEDASVADRTAAQQELSDAQVELARAEVRADLLDKTLASALATAASSRTLAAAQGANSGEPEKGTERAQIANDLREMQREYIENINADALVVACISALDRPQKELTALSHLCSAQLAAGGLLAKVMKTQSESVQIQKQRNLHDSDISAIESHAKQLKRIRDAVDKLGVKEKSAAGASQSN